MCATFFYQPIMKSNSSLLVPCLAVFSSNYNYTAPAMAFAIMNQDPKYADIAGTAVGSGTIKMLVYAGSIFGMVIMGYFGDLLGRRKAMPLTLFMVAFGALGSALFAWGDAITTMVIVGVFRFLLGIGSGGVYPLSAVSAAEGTASSRAEDRSPRISAAYGMNVPAIMSPYILAAIVWNITRDVEVNWRILLGFGAIPALLVWIPSIRVKDSEEFVRSKFGKSIFHALGDRSHWYSLLGTGVCWFCYDVTAYGILLAQPDITKGIWGATSTINAMIWQNLVLNAVGIPGCYMGILVVKQMGAKWLQVWGFMGLFLSSLVMAIVSAIWPTNVWLLFSVLMSVNFFINWGASITTFILPSLVFPPECRATYNGIAAAMGKAGAILGIYGCKALLKSLGLAPMMVFAGSFSLAAAIITLLCVDPVPKTMKAFVMQASGSLLTCIPFCNLVDTSKCLAPCRRKKVADAEKHTMIN
eukprot:GHVT01045258.1.p1 GENE.GHVT01045258.1~~GHVT01045258.1.p1  ORF type:complete len:471 (+),score=31.78 GHVT01045258.1:854-2266(+)